MDRVQQYLSEKSSIPKNFNKEDNITFHCLDYNENKLKIKFNIKINQNIDKKLYNKKVY